MDFNRSTENTYRLEPKEGDRFYPSKVRALIEEVLTKHLTDKEYDHKMAQTQVETIVRQIQQQLKNLSIPAYKTAVQAVIG